LLKVSVILVILSPVMWLVRQAVFGIIASVSFWQTRTTQQAGMSFLDAKAALQLAGALCSH